MKKSFLFPLLFAATAIPLAVRAQQTPAVKTAELTAADLVVADPNKPTQTPLIDTKEKKVKVVAPVGLFSPPAKTRPLKVAVYFGAGAGAGNSRLLVTASKRIEGTTVDNLSPEDFATKDLSSYDVVVFAGGSGSGQAKALGEAGRENVKKFVKNGGGYLGICAGAYLATSGYPWSLGLFNAKTIQPWARGGGAVALQMTDEGKSLFGKVDAPFPVRYNNGPVIEPDDKKDVPPYKVIAYFRDELPKANIPPGQMPNTPAIVTSEFGKGKVLTISPHFEGTKNMENFLPSVIAWLGDKTPAK
jgi:glutamine amidotransferase-like uncharacterized protein